MFNAFLKVFRALFTNVYNKIILKCLFINISFAHLLLFSAHFKKYRIYLIELWNICIYRLINIFEVLTKTSISIVIHNKIIIVLLWGTLQSSWNCKKGSIIVSKKLHSIEIIRKRNRFFGNCNKCNIEVIFTFYEFNYRATFWNKCLFFNVS